MSVALIDYGSGNLHSARKALERAARDTGRNPDLIEVTDDPERVRRADRIVLPGVGAFADCMQGLRGVPGLLEAIGESVCDRGRPFLGICVGMQLMATRGLENDDTPGLGWISGDVRRIDPIDPDLKIPHMGWNTLQVRGAPHPVLGGLDAEGGDLHAYFVHSFHLDATFESDIVATAEYGGSVTAVVARDNLVGTQFHPEKSQRLGLGLIANFLAWAP